MSTCEDKVKIRGVGAGGLIDTNNMAANQV